MMQISQMAPLFRKHRMVWQIVIFEETIREKDIISNGGVNFPP